MRWLGLATLAAILLSGSLAQPFPRDEVAFESVEREHFDAIAVLRARGEATASPLIVRVHVIGDGADADLSLAEAFLAKEFNVILERDARGAPLFLTRSDLSATSGRSTLGATVGQGMAVEATNPRLTNCIAAHELLHFLGLRHVTDDENIMHPQCTPSRLAQAEVTPEQRERVDELASIRATTPRGVITWAYRASAG